MEEAMKVTNLTRVFKGAGGGILALKKKKISLSARKLILL